MNDDPQVYLDAFDGKLKVRAADEPFVEVGTVQVPAHLVAEALAAADSSS